jgi:heme A synthase
VAVVVIIWGAVVRATGSGAGCGAHWPLCNGVVVPLAPRIATVIEFTHRLSSGLLVVLSIALVAVAWRWYPPGHAVRRAALWSFVFVLIEAAIGAGIVLLQLVEHNASALRAGYVAAHLTNTMFLVAMFTASVRAARLRPGAPPGLGRPGWKRPLAVGLAAVVGVCAAGAVVALGDTLFPARSLAAGLSADLDPAAHFLIRLRLWHPVFATVTSLYLVAILTQGPMDHPGAALSSRCAIGLVVIQVALGAVNVLTLAPLAIQMAHLLVSNLLWIALVWTWLAGERP